MLWESLSLIHLQKERNNLKSAVVVCWFQKCWMQHMRQTTDQSTPASRWDGHWSIYIWANRCHCGKQLFVMCPHTCNDFLMPVRADPRELCQPPGNPSFWDEEDRKSNMANMLCVKPAHKVYFCVTCTLGIKHTTFNHQKVILCGNPQCSPRSCIRCCTRTKASGCNNCKLLFKDRQAHSNKLQTSDLWGAEITHTACAAHALPFPAHSTEKILQEQPSCTKLGNNTSTGSRKLQRNALWERRAE